MAATAELAPTVGRRQAHRLTGGRRSTHYRHLAPQVRRPPRPREAPASKLSVAEREQVLEVLGSERFLDTSPGAVVATLLDEGRYLASERTFYRVLAAAGGGEIRERRNQLTHPPYARPELLASCPNQVWSWDITKLRGPVKHSWFQLYSIIDIYSRATVGWMVADRESELLAKRLLADTIVKHNVPPGQLTVHADRGPSMRSQSVAQLLAGLGVDKTHNRPYTSSDNPYSEAQFRTLKYHPGYPSRFATLAEAETWCQRFFDWYNNHHRHSGIEMLTPADVHQGLANERLARRHDVMLAAAERHPHRFTQPPRRRALPDAVYINPPLTE